jgi:hypothetical protein
MLDNPDYLYTSTDLGIWSTLEIGVALTASSLGTLRPLMRRISLFHSSTGGTRFTGNSRGRANNTPSAMNVAGNTPPVTLGTSRIQVSSNPRDEDTWRNGRDRKESMDVELVTNHRGSDSRQDTDIESGYNVEGTESRSWLRN